MKKYKYNSETPCHTSLIINNVLEDISFYKNGLYDLPVNNPFVKSLVAQGKLSPQKKLK